MRLIVLGLIALFSFSVYGLSFETKYINGSLWYAAHNNGTISPYVWLNASSGNAQMATTQTNSSRELIAHSNWTTFHYGFARWNGALGRFVGQGSDDLSEFTTYGFTDNATYWRAEANGTRSVGGRSLISSLKHYQGNYDDFVNETWELSYSTNLTLGFDLWYFQSMKNISFLDTASYGNETYFTGHPLNETQYFDNFTYLTVINFSTAEGWQYSMPVTDYGNKLAIYNGSVYIGINVGRKVGALRTWSLQKIDATPCSSTCSPGDSVNVDINQTDSNSCGQVGYQLCNNSFEASWQDSLSSCTLGGQCKLRLVRNIPSSIGSTYVTINGSRGTPPGSAWATCNVESQDIADSRGGCTLFSATPALAEVPDSTNINARPLKGLSYPFNITQVGVYNILGFNALVKACLQTWGGGVYNVCSVAVDPAGTDTVIPNVTLPGIINNSMNTFYSTNGSLDWVNITLNWGCYDNGLCNNSVLYDNTSGALTKVAQHDLIDFWNATDPYTFNYSKNKMYRVCAIMNDTNKNSNSTSGNPKVCYQFAVNIIPNPQTTIWLNLITPNPEDFSFNSKFNKAAMGNPFMLEPVIALAALVFLFAYLYTQNQKRDDRQETFSEKTFATIRGIVYFFFMLFTIYALIWMAFNTKTTTERTELGVFQNQTKTSNASECLGGFVDPTDWKCDFSNVSSNLFNQTYATNTIKNETSTVQIGTSVTEKTYLSDDTRFALASYLDAYTWVLYLLIVGFIIILLFGFLEMLGKMKPKRGI